MRFQWEKTQWGEVLRNKRDRKHSQPGSPLDREDKRKSLEKPRVEGWGQRTGAHALLASAPTNKEAKPHLDQAFGLGPVSTSKGQIDQRPPWKREEPRDGGGWSREHGWQEEQEKDLVTERFEKACWIIEE